MNIEAFAAFGSGQELKRFTYDARKPGPWDVEVAISHCGICHSDVHLIDDDWKISQFPLVPGHEIVGTVEKLGSEVRHLEEGARVGIGWQRSACLQCRFCLGGRENLCPKNEATCVGYHGGFADSIVSDSRFVFPLPDELTSEGAGPLLCGGVTVYSPMNHYGVGHTMSVGVVGIGGLGHLALQFARSIGCEVTAFSSTEDKETEARELGASRFVVTRDREALKSLTGQLDFILSTVFVDLDWVAYLHLLRPGGRLCLVGAPAEPIAFPASSLVVNQLSVSGSVIGGRAMILEMLQLAARHGIKARTELYPLENVNEALARVREGKARYRAVLKTR